MYFESTLNTRALLPDSLRFIRSDAPYKLTDEELKWLKRSNITTVIDLRSDEEAKMCPSAFASAEGFDYRIMPVTGGNSVPKTIDDVVQSYIDMADQQMDKIVETILSAESNVLFFCSAGKDRTGVVSAILLHRLGYSEDYIIADYMKSAESLKELLEAYAKSGVADINVITPRPENIRGLLASLE
jgi:protein tyrosine/serine phosphatase